MKTSGCCFWVVPFLSLAAAASAFAADESFFAHPGMIHSADQLDETRQMVFQEQQPWKDASDDLLLRANGDEGMGRSSHAIADFNVPGYYIDPEGHIRASEALNGDGWAAYACALAYQLTGDPVYAQKSIELLNAWAYLNTRYSGADGALVMSYAGVSLAFAGDLIWSSDLWDPADRDQFRRWVSTVLRSAGDGIKTRPNNWGAWGTLAVIASDYLLDDVAGVDAEVARLQSRIDTSIALEGYLPDETSRGDRGIWYTYFALAPLTAGCQIAWNARGVDLFHYGRLHLAVDYLFYYSLHPDQWPHYGGQQVLLPTPDNWPGNLFEAMVRIYNAPDYENWIAATRPHVLKGHHYAWTVPTLMRPLALPTNGLAESILEVMRRASDWQIAHLAGGEPKDWTWATFYAGLMASYGTTGESRYLDRAITWAEVNGWRLGPRMRHADDQCAGQTYLELYQLDPQSERIAPTQQTLDLMVADPHPGRVDWWWCDALFMAPPVFARLGALTGDPGYFDLMSMMWWDTTDFLFDPSEGLFYRDSNYFNRQCPNGQKMFWSRGNGWVVDGIVRVLQYLPLDYPDRQRFIDLLQTMAQRLAGLQKPDGYWASCLTDADDYPWPETSGTAAFTYALAWGINEGLLDPDQFSPTVFSGWSALVNAVNADGRLGWVQPPSGEPGISHESDTAPYGVGLFLLAGSEVFRLVSR
jgi:rhamnogalacturonyl hydrolase YesR